MCTGRALHGRAQGSSAWRPLESRATRTVRNGWPATACEIRLVGPANGSCSSGTSLEISELTPQIFPVCFFVRKKKTINNNIHAFSELPKNSQRNLAVIWHQVCTSCATCRAYISLVVAAKDLVKNKKYGVHHGFSPKRSGILQPQRCNLDRKTDDKPHGFSGFPSIFRQVSPTSVCLKIGVPGTPFHPLANLHRLTHPQCSQSETPWAHHNSLEVPRFEHPILGPWAMTKL